MDDTAKFNNAFALGDLDVQAGTYSISGEVDIPTGRNMKCESGAVLFFPESKPTIRAFAIGVRSNSLGNNAVWGCDFEGTDTATDYSTFTGGTSGYMSMFDVTQSLSGIVQNVLFENNQMNNSQGDYFITFAGCGTLTATSWQCNFGAIPPDQSGPQYVYAVNNTFRHCAAAPGVHFNGGQHLLAQNNTFIDCDADDEADGNVLQIIQSYWYNNTLLYLYGAWDALHGHIVHAQHTLTGDDLIAEDSSGSQSVSNIINNQRLHEPNGCAGGGGHYSSEILQNGATLDTGC